MIQRNIRTSGKILIWVIRGVRCQAYRIRSCKSYRKLLESSSSMSWLNITASLIGGASWCTRMLSLESELFWKCFRSVFSCILTLWCLSYVGAIFRRFSFKKWEPSVRSLCMLRNARWPLTLSYVPHGSLQLVLGKPPLCVHAIWPSSQYSLHRLVSFQKDHGHGIFSDILLSRFVSNSLPGWKSRRFSLMTL